MVIELPADLEAALTELAQKQAGTPERLALIALRARFLPESLPIQPRDDWELGLLAIATDCGQPLPDTTYSREEMYD
jgi:hypothetical protein